MDGEPPTPVAEAPPPPPQDQPAGPLQAFLSDRDVPCPNCGYNLRGITAAACPECGREVELALREPHPLAARRALLLLALLWLLAIGAVQAARSGVEIRRTVSRSGQTATVLRYALAANAATLSSAASANRAAAGAALAAQAERHAAAETLALTLRNRMAPTPIVIAGDRSTTATVSRPALTLNGPVTVYQSQTPLLFTPTLTRPTPTTIVLGSSASWSGITWWQWTRSGLWAGVALLGLLGMVLVLVYRRRTPGRRVIRAIMASAWIGFLLTVGIELQSLIWELV